MRAETAFHLSSYLTLALACACLGFAEITFLPAAPLLLVASAAFLLVGYCLEGHWSLSARHANLLGIAILILTVCWVGNLYSLALSGQDWNGIPWPAVLLPHAGPLLMLLLLAKLFRPKKTADYWFLHTIGLLHVALACVLVAEPFFAILLFAYLVCGLWCLSLLQMHRREIAAAPLSRAGDASALDKQATQASPGPLAGLRRAGRWAVVVGVMGLILFLTIPRRAALLWDPGSLSSPGRQRLETGYTSEIDLGASGSVQVSDAVAFEVDVADARGRPKEDLGDDQRWRGSTLSRYDSGRWSAGVPISLYKEAGITARRGQGFLPKPSIERRHTSTIASLPDLGSRQISLTVAMDRARAGGFFLAEPIVLPKDPRQHPYKCLSGHGLDAGRHLFYEMDGTLCGLPKPRHGHFSYLQVTVDRSAGTKDATAPRWLLYPEEFYVNFNADPLPALREWARALLERLFASGEYGLTRQDVGEGDVPLPAASREPVARALAKFLATGGEYRYSLDLRRSGRQKDPTLDFLLVVKQGHCERFAGGLALVLRSLGIPARVVNGFRGAEHQEGGHYLVRQSHAHSWVEALVLAPDLEGRRAWLALDPTPPNEANRSPDRTWSQIWEAGLSHAQELWRAFVVDFSPDQQREALASLGSFLAPRNLHVSLGELFSADDSRVFWMRPGFWILLAGASVIGFFLVRQLRRRRRGPSFHHAEGIARVYRKLLTILDRTCGLRPGPAQTPRELAQSARLLLQAMPLAVGLADLPVEVAALYYRGRFGRQALSEQDLRPAEERLDLLDRSARPRLGKKKGQTK